MFRNPNAPPERLSRAAKGGFTLAEVLVTVGLTAVLLVVYSMVLTGTIALRRSQWNTQASNLIQEEMDSLRQLPYYELLNRTDGRFLNVTLNRGRWSVIHSTDDGQGNRLALTAAAPEILDESGLIALPANQQTAFTFSAKIRAMAASPSGWDAGLVFRYRDSENHYRFRFTSGGIAFDKVVHGAITTIWSQNASYSTNTWYTLEVVAAGDSFTLKKNGATLTTLTDPNFSKGDLGLAAFNGALIEGDDVTLTVGAATDSWDFEVYTPGLYPEDWRRIGWPDLPDGNGTLTIADYLGETQMKEVTVKISWTETDRTKTVSGTSIITE